ncbi:MAG: ABC transporter ATP-binding protein [Planctomycetota bacterium]
MMSQNITQQKAKNIVEIENLTKTYRREDVEITPLAGINLSMREGEFLSLMGPSGSGKSTLLNLVAGIDTPSAGKIFVNSQNLAELSDNELAKWRNRNVGYIFQLYNLVPVLTAYENVELPLLLLALSAKKRREHVMTALEAVGVHDRINHYPRQLSGGQEQRVAIARAIVTDPKVLVADEPTGDLDAKAEAEILQLLKELNKKFNKSIMMVTHDPKAAAFADRQLHLDKGVLTEETL